MCGRYTLSEMPEWSELGVRVPEGLLLAPRYNAAPGRPQLVIVRERGGGGLVLAEAPWGVRLGERFLINARRESLGGRAWRGHARRCVVPADGYVEWRPPAEGEGARKVPVWLRRQGEAKGKRAPLMYLAGLMMPDGFVVVTTPPSAQVAAIHDRMPAILPPRRVGAWLDAPPSALGELARPAPEGLLRARELGPRINAVAHDDAGCLTGIDVALNDAGEEKAS